MVLTGQTTPSVIKTSTNTEAIIKNTCIDIQVHPKPRLNTACYKIFTVVQECSYERGVAAGISDGYLRVFNLTYERYGVCARHLLFINAYKEGFMQVYDPKYKIITPSPELQITQIDNSPIVQGFNYDYRTDTYYITNRSVVMFKDLEYVMSRSYIIEPDYLVNNSVEDLYDGTFKWTISDDTLAPDTDVLVNVEAIDLEMEKSVLSELRVTTKDVSNVPIIEVTGGRDFFNKALLNLNVNILNFKKGFKVYPDGMPVEFPNTNIASVEYPILLDEFYKTSATTYVDGSYLIYSETDGLLGEYPFSIKHGLGDVDISFFISHVEKMKIVFKIRAVDYLHSKSEYGYGVIYIDAVPDITDTPLIGQLTTPFWYALTSIKLNILNYIQGHTYAVYLEMSSELNDPHYKTRYEYKALYLSNLTRDSFYIPYDEYKFLEYATGDYEYYWIGSVIVFDVTDGFPPDLTTGYIAYVPKVDNTAIEKVAHWAGVSNGASTTRTDNYFLKPKTGFGITS